MKTVFILLAMFIVSVSAEDTILANENWLYNDELLLRSTTIEPISTMFVFGDNLETALRIGFKDDNLQITTEMSMDSASQVFLEFLKKYLTTPENWCDKKGGKN